MRWRGRGRRLRGQSTDIDEWSFVEAVSSCISELHAEQFSACQFRHAPGTIAFLKELHVERPGVVRRHFALFLLHQAESARRAGGYAQAAADAALAVHLHFPVSVPVRSEE